MLILPVELIADCCRVIGNNRKLCDVPERCMYKDYFRLELVKLRIVEHRVLPVLIELRLVKCRSDSIVQQKKFQYINYIVRSRSAENCYTLFNERFISFQEFFFDRASFFHNITRIKRIF